MELDELLRFQVRALDSPAIAPAFLFAEGWFVKFAVVQVVSDSGHNASLCREHIHATKPSP